MPQPSGSQSDHSTAPSTDLGANEWLVEEMYDQYQRDPQSVDATWVAYFKASPPGGSENGNHGTSSAPATTPAPLRLPRRPRVRTGSRDGR